MSNELSQLVFEHDQYYIVENDNDIYCGRYVESDTHLTHIQVCSCLISPFINQYSHAPLTFEYDNIRLIERVPNPLNFSELSEWAKNNPEYII